MKTFMISGVNNQIFFKNLNRRPPIEELNEALSVLRLENFDIEGPVEMGLEDVYYCRKHSLSFRLLYTGEEALVSISEASDIPKIRSLFERHTSQE